MLMTPTLTPSKLKKLFWLRLCPKASNSDSTIFVISKTIEINSVVLSKQL